MRSIAPPNTMQTAIATRVPINTTTGPGSAVAASALITDNATSAPTITTSPWAKLMRPRMPYTMV